MIVVSIIVGCVLLAGIVAALSLSRDLLIRQTLKHQVVVELKSGETFKGVLAATDAHTVLLRNVEAITDNQTANMIVDGQLLVPRGDVKFLQRP